MEQQHASAKTDSKTMTELDAIQPLTPTPTDSAAEAVETRAEEFSGLPPAPVHVPVPVVVPMPASVPGAMVTGMLSPAGPVTSPSPVASAGSSTPSGPEASEVELPAPAPMFAPTPARDDSGLAGPPLAAASISESEPSGASANQPTDGSTRWPQPASADAGQLRQLLTDLNAHQQQVVELITALLDQNRMHRDALAQLASQVGQLSAQNSHALSLQTGG